MKLTHEELAAVAAYEKQLQTAIRSNYLRNVGRSGLAILVPIYERVTGTKQAVHDNCAACILGFLKRIGVIYFADKAEQEQEQRKQPQPAATPETESAPTTATGHRGRRAQAGK